MACWCSNTEKSPSAGILFCGNQYSLKPRLMATVHGASFQHISTQGPILHSSAEQVSSVRRDHFLLKACPNPLFPLHTLLECLEPIKHLWHGWCPAYKGDIVNLDPTKVPFFHICKIENHLHWVCVTMGRTFESEGRIRVCLLTLGPTEKHLGSNHPKPGRSKKQSACCTRNRVWGEQTLHHHTCIGLDK